MRIRNRDIRCRTAMEAVALYIASSRSRGYARRGTVMVFVMAILGILFIAGVAFLQEVTFGAKTIEADEQVRAREAIVDSIEVLVESTLKAGVAGKDGIPYSPASSELVYDITPSLLTDGSDPLGYSFAPYQYLQWKSYGLLLSPWTEVPGIHPLIAQIEPHVCNLVHDEAPDSEKVAFDTRPRIANTNELWGVTDGPKYPAIIAQPRLDWGDIAGEADGADKESRWQRWWHPITDPTATLVAECEINMDSDGDGVVDSLGLRFEPGNTNNAAFRSITASQWENAFGKNKEDNQLYSGYAAVGVRVIPHTALCNLVYSHPWTINYVLGDDAIGSNIDTGSYSPYSIEMARPVSNIVEPAIRNRNMIPERNAISDSLLDSMSNTTTDNPLISAFTTSNNGYRWWLFDPENTDDLNPNRCGGAYCDAINPLKTIGMSSEDSAEYDRRHLVTTVSTDDLLLRGVRFPAGHPFAGQDVIEYIVKDNSLHKTTPDANDGSFKLDDYIRKYNRVQLSFVELDNEITASPAEAIWSGFTTQTEKEQAVADAIRDMFWVMLWNQPDMNGNGIYEYKDSTNLVEGDDDWIRAVQAASLAANVMDYADFEPVPGNSTLDLNIPTKVNPVDPTIAADAFANYQVFGFEKQPFITEVYAEYDSALDGGACANTKYVLNKATTQYAIELFNPYNTPLKLSGYTLEAIDSGDLNDLCFDEMDPDPVDLNVELDDITIPAHSFWTILGYGTAANIPSNVTTSDPFVFRNTCIIVLKRHVTINGTDYDFVVDEVDLTNESLAIGYDEDADFGDWEEPQSSPEPASIQRDTNKRDEITENLPATNGDAWRFITPFAAYTEEDSTTLGSSNATPAELTDSRFTRPVVATTSYVESSLSDAFPTTGCMLFPVRYAHLVDNSQSSEKDKYTPFNRAILGRSLISDRLLIDNGHMPVFDPTDPSSVVVDADNIPYWQTNYHGYVPAWPAASDAPLNPFCGQPGGFSQLPWGQYIFDYFTRLPLNTNQTLDEYLNPNGPQYLNHYPYVEENGLRVHGRININAAPWKVLAGLPMKPFYRIETFLPEEIKSRFESMLFLSGSMDQYPILDYPAAYSIVAYREACDIPGGCTLGDDLCSRSYAGRILPPKSNEVDPSLNDDKVVVLPGIRQGKGFLSVGELFNVRHPDVFSSDWGTSIYRDKNTIPVERLRMDGGIVGRANSGLPYEDYIQAITWTIACCDWATTKSNVFTVYGVLSDPGPDLQPDADARKKINDSAIRFQETLDRTPLLSDPGASMSRIGERKISMYNDPRSD